MSKAQTTHYIGMNDQGLYWAGYNTWTDQIRKAKLYNSAQRAHEHVKEAVERSNQWLHPPIASYTILTIEINILGAEEVVLEEEVENGKH